MRYQIMVTFWPQNEGTAFAEIVAVEAVCQNEAVNRAIADVVDRHVEGVLRDVQGTVETHVLNVLPF